MTYEFNAIACESDARSLFFGFADDNHYVWLQPDDEICATAEGDHIWLEIIDQPFGAPGGIKNVRLSRQEFLVHLTTARAMHTSGFDTISVNFAVSDEQFEKLKAVLRKSFRECDQLMEILG
jgi:hypothetical protein